MNKKVLYPLRHGSHIESFPLSFAGASGVGPNGNVSHRLLNYTSQNFSTLSSFIPLMQSNHSNYYINLYTFISCVLCPLIYRCIAILFYSFQPMDCCAYGNNGQRTNGYDCVEIPAASMVDGDMLKRDRFCGSMFANTRCSEYKLCIL